MPGNVYICRKPLVLSDERQIAVLRASIETLQAPPSLIVIDTLTQTFDGDESASSDVSAYLRLVNAELREPFGATVIIVHHTGHNDGKRPRGSSAIMANLDFVIGAFRPSEDAMQVKLTVTKMKDGERLNDLHFALTQEHLGFDDDGDAITSLVATHEAAPPAVVGRVSDGDWRRVQEVVARKPWRLDPQTKDEWVGHAFVEALGINISRKRQITALIKQAIDEGILRIYEKPKSGRNPLKFVIVGDPIEA